MVSDLVLHCTFEMNINTLWTSKPLQAPLLSRFVILYQLFTITTTTIVLSLLQSDDIGDVEELLTLIEAINLSPKEANCLTAAIHGHINSTGDIQDVKPSGPGNASLQAPTPSLTTVSIATSTFSHATPPTLASIPTPPATVVVYNPTAHSATTLVQQLGAAKNLTTVPDPALILPVISPQMFPIISPPSVPSKYPTISHGNITFLLSLPNVPGPYYLITKEKSVGIVAEWHHASSLVMDVKGVVFYKT
ncbi:hypothetical protein HD554DRAFT_2168082 [Boletus coccyginus]|nr:hypothetical protein HD554DRAFT_2168082 [Boletus coccyginus]